MALCNNKKYEREFVKLISQKGFTCFRIAGSGSATEAVCDCVLYLPEPCLVEVKATKEEINTAYRPPQNEAIFYIKPTRFPKWYDRLISKIIEWCNF